MLADRITGKVCLTFPATEAEHDAYAGRAPQQAQLACGTTNATPEHGNQQDDDQQFRERLKAEAIAFVTGRPIDNSTTDNQRN